jgi:hypothetical protein
MGHNDHIDFELHDRIEELLAQGHFEAGTKEHGVALFYADNGYSALSPKQRVLFDKAIAPILETPINDEERLHKALEQDWADEANSRPESI